MQHICSFCDFGQISIIRTFSCLTLCAVAISMDNRVYILYFLKNIICIDNIIE